MTNKKTTKRALLTSAMAMLLCFTMLLGTTYAWFTDSVTSGSNIIQSGTLDVDLVDAQGDTMEGQIIEFVAADGRGQSKILWEPGCTYETEPVYVVNKGNLALQWKLGINGISGDAKLLEAIEWTVTVGTTTVALDALSGKLLADEKTEAIVLTGHMKEDAGNEYQGLTAEGISITVFATQFTSEVDSTDNQYDKMATIDSEAELTEALAADYDLITLGANFELTDTVTIPAGKTVTIDLCGYVISQTKDCTETYSMFANNGNLTINDSVGTGKISFTQLGLGGDSAWATYTIRNAGTLVVNNGTIEHLGNQSGNANNAIFSYSGDTTINGGTILCPYSRSVRQWQGSLTINGGRFDGQVWIQALYDCTTTITGGNFKPGTCGNDASSVFVTNDSKVVTLTVSGGNFATKLGMSSAVKCVSGGTFGVDPSAYVVDGMKAVQVGNVYEVIPNTITYATASNAAELQAALDNAANENLIVLTADIEGDVTAKQVSGLEIIINGDGHKYAGVILVDGNSATELTSKITLKNINFVADSISADACIQLGNGTTGTRYTCNVTVDNCTFDVPGAVGVKSYTGGDKNLKLVKCTATESTHSLAQLKGIDGVVVENCTVNAIRGINLNNSLNVIITGSTIDVQKYAVRFGESANTTVENYEIINTTIISDNVDGDAAIVLRAGATNANLTLTNTTITAGVAMSGHENANVVTQ